MTAELLERPALMPTFHTEGEGAAYTLGPVVAQLGEGVGFAPDLQQRMILDAAFAFDRNGLPVHSEVCVVGPRQNLKTGVEKLIALGWAVVLERPLTVWSAHEYSTAQESFRDLATMFENSDSLGRLLAPGPTHGIMRAEGRESITLELEDGQEQRILFRARTKSGGRGLSGDDVMLDEAFALKAAHLGALLPIMLTRPHGQIVYGSSAGLIDSDALRALRTRGRRGDRRLAYFEWCDPDPHNGCATEDCDHDLLREGCALDDEARWWASNPTLGHRITVESIRVLRNALEPAEFARECLGWWDEPSSAEVGITLEAWEKLADAEQSPQGGRIVFGIDSSPGLTWTSIVASDGVRSEVVARKPGQAWVVDWCKIRAPIHRPLGFALIPGSPAGSLLKGLTKAGLDVIEVAGQEEMRSVTNVVKLVDDGTLVHRGELELAAAVAGARRRKVGDAFRWSRRDSGTDISPLVALTVALWAASTAPEPKRSAYSDPDSDVMIV